MAYFGVTAIADVTALIVKHFANITRYDTDITKYYKFSAAAKKYYNVLQPIGSISSSFFFSKKDKI